jgi:hypothetical protein
LADPLTSAAVGKGLDEATKKGRELAARFRDRNVAFIQDGATISAVREARKTAEYLTLHRFVQERRERVLLSLGIVWRSYQSDQQRMHKERAKVIKAHGLPGLHLAEAMQAGLLKLIESELERMGLPNNTLEEEMRAVVDEVDRFVTFVQTESTVNEELSLVLHKGRSFFPRVFVVAGSGTAVEVASEVAREANKRLPDYDVRRNQRGQQVAFVFWTKF